ncbi:GNAT family N-acetyltransferase [Agarivorans sp. QJM3NY_25]|uniref:GNAT family N-acetyltransferase n=1 Tax=Agarivorans sp. QJM3NY_25 TaxID=3421430 RepID=UPI003D7EF912
MKDKVLAFSQMSPDYLVHQQFPTAYQAGCSLFNSPIFLQALEQQRCVGDNSGWLPRHIELCDAQILIPSYIKQHSYGEYVFDWSWADAYHRYGLQYYPKLVSAIPFTPITSEKHLGQRLSEAAVKDWVQVVISICQEQQLSSWHCNFIDVDLAEQLAALGLMIRHGVQFEWFNHQYHHFDDFLQTFTSRKRKNTNKERRTAQGSVEHINRLVGQQISQTALEAFYQCYQSTYLKRGQQGYLSFSFFQQLLEQLGDSMLLVTAENNQQIVASALFFFDADNLYGRYWGCLEEYPCLHFELCFYQGIEFAIERGLKRFNPGTQGEHKLLRGFEPVTTYSAHYIKQADFAQVIADFCAQERQQMVEYGRQCQQLLPFKTKPET